MGDNMRSLRYLVIPLFLSSLFAIGCGGTSQATGGVGVPDEVNKNMPAFSDKNKNKPVLTVPDAPPPPPPGR